VKRAEDYAGHAGLRVMVRVCGNDPTLAGSERSPSARLNFEHGERDLLPVIDARSE